MKITMYELLGMVKDGKDLPKKIKYGNDIYVLQENLEDYATWSYDNLDLLNDIILGHFNIEDVIYLELEILEEEKKIPEKLSTWFSVETKQSKELNIECANTNFENMYEKINEIIDCLDYLKSKGE